MTKIFPQIQDDNTGDHGLVTCGKCGSTLERGTAFLAKQYLYLCEECNNENAKLFKITIAYMDGEVIALYHIDDKTMREIDDIADDNCQQLEDFINR